MYFRFCGLRHFSYNAENKPESNTTRRFRRVRQMAAPGAKSAVYLTQVVETGGRGLGAQPKFFFAPERYPLTYKLLPTPLHQSTHPPRKPDFS